jgi:DNA-binding transcriptional LysR family regulator
MDINGALRAFVRTVERGSITAAARDLAVSQPAVTKQLRNLELHVNARLLERSSRSVRPTAHGMALYEVSRQALASIDAALEGVRRSMGEIEGNLRLHAPSCIGSQHLHGIVMDFQDEYAGIGVELVLDNRNVDLIHENFDMAIRYGKIEDQDLVMRRIGWIQRILVASPSYLRRVGPIDTPQRLTDVDIVTTTTALSERNTLSLRDLNQASAEVPVRAVFKTNNAHVLLNTLLAGRGVGPVQRNLVVDAMAKGELVRILPDFFVKPTEAFLVYPSTKFMRPVVRAFTDFVIPRLRAVDGITRDAHGIGAHQIAAVP